MDVGRHKLGALVTFALMSVSPSRLPALVDPSNDQAREWLARELSRGEYQATPSLMERVLDWLARLLTPSGTGAGVPAWTVTVVVVLVVAVIALVAWRILRREPAAAPVVLSGALFDNEALTAAQWRERAREALEVGDPGLALIEAFRALVAASIERTLLDDVPGRTAREAARGLGPFFPSEQAELTQAAATFDGVRYGGQIVRPETARAILDLEQRLLGLRPSFLDEPSPRAPVNSEAR